MARDGSGGDCALRARQGELLLHAEIRLTELRGAAFEVKSATCDAPWVTVGPLERAGEGWRIGLSLTPRRAGFAEARLEVVTDVPGEERLSLPIGVRSAAP